MFTNTHLIFQVYSVNKMGSRESRSPWGQITDTLKDKLDTVVRGRRHSKEHSDRSVPGVHEYRYSI